MVHEGPGPEPGHQTGNIHGKHSNGVLTNGNVINYAEEKTVTPLFEEIDLNSCGYSNISSDDQDTDDNPTTTVDVEIENEYSVENEQEYLENEIINEIINDLVLSVATAGRSVPSSPVAPPPPGCEEEVRPRTVSRTSDVSGASLPRHKAAVTNIASQFSVQQPCLVTWSAGCIG